MCERSHARGRHRRWSNQGCSNSLPELSRSRPMWIEAGRIEDCLERWASLSPRGPVLMV
jgi:hypothetical protein